MKYLLFLSKVLFDEAKKRNFILKTLFFAIFYVALSVILVNYKSYFSFLSTDYPVLSKLRILFLIFVGSFQAIALKDVVLLILTAVLFGLNIELVFRKVKFLASVGSLHLAFGSGLISLVATGCASCGLSLASIVGLSAVLAALPFGGAELYAFSIIVLLISLFYNLHTLVKVCKIERP